ncbi:hypothetical protein KJI95_05370 [Shewanella sp. JM162201]|uniref:Uncharacterized protein n=1 Tax=Shewanella jiangmenensis TaxID=2837387 RepID=A0ABS5V0G0_9GAMM|nr:hypothetical protein [Shewanella jiangmenensis]MBT1443954.1 hypothetical protein [Shewanella jiangmenensis]
MFIQVFAFIIAVFCVALGVKHGDMLLVIAGAVGMLSGVHLVYQIRTGKSLLETWGTRSRKTQRSNT